MARVDLPNYFNQPSMAAGEIGPELYGRVDQELYYIGLRTARNAIIKQYGGAMNRAGTHFTAEAKDSTKQVRLIPFQFNESQTYALELGDESLRVISNSGEIIESTYNITGITQANPAVVTTSGAHGYSTGNDVFIAGVAGMTDVNGRSFRVTVLSATTFSLQDYSGNNINSSSYPAYGSGGTVARIYTQTTPWDASDLFELNYAQSADVITVCHPDYPMRDITRTTNTNWTVTEFDVKNGPFKDINGDETKTVYASAATGTGITITASSAIFEAGDVDSLFYIEQNSTDATKGWDVQKGINASEVRRAGFNYYQAPASPSSTYNVSSCTTSESSVVIVTTAAHGLSNGNAVYVSGTGFYKLDSKFFRVRVINTTTVVLEYLTGGDVTDVSASGTTGTIKNAFATGTIKPEHDDGTEVDGDPGTPWTFLHSGFGIVRITAIGGGGTTATADVIKRLPDNVVGSGGATFNWAKAAWSSTQGYPSACAYHKQRFITGGTTLEPNRIWMSGVNLRTEFGRSRPVLDDEEITIVLDTTEVNAVRHLLGLSSLIVLTSSSEQLVNGRDDALLATDPPNAKVQGYNGANRIKPIIIGNTALYVENTGDVLRTLQYQLDTDSFTGIDLTARSPHLFRNKTIVDWAYHKRPYSVIWVIQDDGSLLGLTFMAEQKVYAWHRHDTDGIYESVCCINEGDETGAYFVVKRTINGVTKRYIERMASRQFTVIEDAMFVDSGLSYDGRNTTATTITISGGTTWDTPEVLTLTASSSIFVSTDVGNQIQFVNGNVTYRLDITAYTSGTVVSAIPTKELPVAYRSTARTDWRFARKTFKNLWHIEGKTVSILADGSVLPQQTVASGQLTLPRPSARCHIGLPFASELETLDLAQPAGQTKAVSVNIPTVFITAQETRGLYVAANEYKTLENTTGDIVLDGFTLMQGRSPEIGYDPAIPAQTDVIEVGTQAGWSNRGRIAIRQTDPLPYTVNCITTENIFGTR